MRNRPKRRALIAVAVALGLLALAGRAHAASADVALAARFAHALTGSDADDADDADNADDADDADDDDDDATDSADADADHAEADHAADTAVPNIGDFKLDADPDDLADADTQVDDADDAGGRVGALALFDAEQSPAGIAGDDDARFAAGSAGGDEIYEAGLRRRAPRWGRVDVGLSLKRTTTVPLHTPSYRREELWLVATWRH